MDINDFNPPDRDPIGMLDGKVVNASEKETILTLLLAHCIQEKNLDASFEFMYQHPSMVNDGLLIHEGGTNYRLTKKAKGLLYGYFGKGE